jgi:hypothetical protein
MEHQIDDQIKVSLLWKITVWIAARITKLTALNGTRLLRFCAKSSNRRVYRTEKAHSCGQSLEKSAVSAPMQNNGYESQATLGRAGLLKRLDPHRQGRSGGARFRDDNDVV